MARDWLTPRFGDRVGWLAGAHVAAKRYLAATDPAYALSEVSGGVAAQAGRRSPRSTPSSWTTRGGRMPCGCAATTMPRKIRRPPAAPRLATCAVAEQVRGKGINVASAEPGAKPAAEPYLIRTALDAMLADLAEGDPVPAEQTRGALRRGPRDAVRQALRTAGGRAHRRQRGTVVSRPKLTQPLSLKSPTQKARWPGPRLADCW